MKNCLCPGLTIAIILCSALINFRVSAQPESLIPQQPVVPSPWWIVDRYGQNLVIETQIDISEQQIILTIDGEVWAGLDYLERYSTLQSLSGAAIPYQYSLVLQNKRKNILASYIPDNRKWTIGPENLGALPLRPQKQ